jgi:hypothetical protein
MWRLKQLWKGLKRSIQSFILWFPVLFSDRWFDSYYLLKIIERKCQHDSKMYRNHGHGIDADVIAYELEEVAAIGHRLQDLDASYYDEHFNPHIEKWKEAHKESLYPRAEASRKQEHDEYVAAMKKGNDALQVDLDRLGELFKKVHTWSD